MGETAGIEKVRRYFDGPYFALNFGLLARARPLLRRLFRRDEDGITEYCCHLLEAVSPRSVLDLGCGSGRLLSELNRRLPLTHAAGVEMSERTLAIARQRLINREKVTLEHAPVQTCRALEQPFDAVMCIGLCDYAPFTEAILRRALLAARMVVVVTVPRRRFNIQRLIRETWLGLHGVILHASSREEIEEVCRRAAGEAWRFEVSLPEGLEDNYWVVARRRL